MGEYRGHAPINEPTATKNGSIGTIHLAKGLEFKGDAVIARDCSAYPFPHRIRGR
jgi:hypothetical protein